MVWHVAPSSGGALFACVCLSVVLLCGAVERPLRGATNEASASLASSLDGIPGAANYKTGDLLAEDDPRGHSSSIRESSRTGRGLSYCCGRSSSTSGTSYGSSTSSEAMTGRHLLYQGGDFSEAWKREYGSSKSRWHPTVLRSALKAEQQLIIPRQERAGRLFVPMLTNRYKNLCCMLMDTSAKVGATNKLDVFVFSPGNTARSIYNKSPCGNRTMDLSLVFLDLDEHWGADPKHSSSAFFDKSGWGAKYFGEKYRRMGHWRLTFQFAFADMLGYKYVWQLDDDSFFKSKVDVDIIQYMQQNDLWVASAKTRPDPFHVSWGLPEMVRLFLVGERMEPPGTLFSKQTQPPGLEGLYTVRNDPVRKDSPLAGDAGGWSRTVMHGNCGIIDMDKFWWPKQVQKFVELVVLSGYHFRFRWNEQGVMAMVWQIFVPEGRFEVDNLPFEYEHPRLDWGTCSGTSL